MSTFTIEELDREEIEFLPPRVVMTTCNPKPTCAPAPRCAPVCEPVYCEPVRCEPTIELCVKVRLGGLLRL